MSVGGIDPTTSKATVERGKGGKGRVVPFGAKAAQALDRYLRARRGHALTEAPALWLGDRSKGFSYDGLYVALKYRAGLANVQQSLGHSSIQTTVDVYGHLTPADSAPFTAKVAQALLG